MVRVLNLSPLLLLLKEVNNGSPCSVEWQKPSAYSVFVPSTKIISNGFFYLWRYFNVLTAFFSAFAL